MPDLNSVPPSPHAPRQLASQQASQQASTTPPASASDSLLNILPSNQSTVNPGASSSSSTATTSQLPQPSPSQPPLAPAPRGESGVGPGPGPLRHPRPLTASELHMELEKEQEHVVNRLSRELSLLRAAHNASVVSSTSSASASTHEPANEASLLGGSGFTIPTSRRHHRRTSSSASQTLSSQAQTPFDGRRPSQPPSMSRQHSTASRTSLNNSPGLSGSLDPSGYFHQQRMQPPSSAPTHSTIATAHGSEQLSPGLMAGTLRYEETQQSKNELEAAKKENELLKRRIRELERQVQERRDADSSRPRSESMSTTASTNVPAGGGVSIAGPREGAPVRPERERGNTIQSVASIGVGVPEGEVEVGESAASSGFREGADRQ